MLKQNVDKMTDDQLKNEERKGKNVMELLI